MEEAEAAIQAFWSWWPSAADPVADAIDADGTPGDHSETLTERVRAIHPKLWWETAPGRNARHRLTVTPRGKIALRLLTQRWFNAAPRADDRWEFAPARQQRERRSIKVADRDVTLDGLWVRATADNEREVLDVLVYHVDFIGLDGTQQARVAFVALDNTLGEDRVERWLGTVETSLTRPDDAIALEDLDARVAALSDRATGERWTAIGGKVTGEQLTLTINRALKCIDHLALCDHVRIDIPLDKPNPRGLTTSEESVQLRKREKELLAALQAHGVLIARETTGGRRILHLHADADARPIIDAWKRRDPRDIGVLATTDPAWDILRRWG